MKAAREQLEAGRREGSPRNTVECFSPEVANRVRNGNPAVNLIELFLRKECPRSRPAKRLTVWTKTLQGI